MQIMEKTRALLEDMGIASANAWATTIAVVVIVVLLWLLYLLMSRGVEKVIDRLTRTTDTKLDDVLLHHSTLRWAWGLIVTVIAYKSIPSMLEAYSGLQTVVVVMLRIAMILLVMMLAIELVRKLFYLLSMRNDKDFAAASRVDADGATDYTYRGSLKGLQQMIVVLIVGVCCILVISTVVGRDPLIIFSGLGAMAAVLMLVFQDSILGVVAGIQITANDLLKEGDWIVAPKFQANGTVQEVTLAAVKVQNWDNSVTTVPPYKLLTEGFQNWRNMFKMQGRRMARSLNIDLHTVRFATTQEEETWKAADWWREPTLEGPLVNLSAFRMYVEHYISQLPTIVPQYLYMVRELQPGADGLPIEIYFFTSQTTWKDYEMTQAAVLDHIIAKVGDFGLRLYQYPTDFGWRKEIR